jgi:hypothetical protein
MAGTINKIDLFDNFYFCPAHVRRFVLDMKNLLDYRLHLEFIVLDNPLKSYSLESPATKPDRAIKRCGSKIY